MRNLRHCGDRQYGDHRYSATEETSLNVWREHGTSSISNSCCKPINYMVEEANSRIYIDCLGGSCLSSMPGLWPVRKV